MATIVEGVKWTLTEAAAKRMVENGLIEQCNYTHISCIESDQPIYHISSQAPDWFGIATILGAIRSAEEHAGLENDIKETRLENE